MPRSARADGGVSTEGVEPEPEVSTAALSNLTPETFQEHYRNIRKFKRKVDEANTDYRNARKAAEAVGVDLKVLALLEKFAKLEEGEADQQITKLFKYAGWLSVPIGTQVSFFDPGMEFIKPEAEDLHRQWAANEAGIAAAKGGGAVEDNPFPAGSPLFVEWDTGFREYQKVAAHQAKTSGKRQASSDRKRREPPTPTVEDPAAGSA